MVINLNNARPYVAGADNARLPGSQMHIPGGRGSPWSGAVQMVVHMVKYEDTVGWKASNSLATWR